MKPVDLAVFLSYCGHHCRRPGRRGHLLDDILPRLPQDSPFRSPLHGNMTIVVGTLVILLTGLLVSRFRAAHVRMWRKR